MDERDVDDHSKLPLSLLRPKVTRRGLTGSFRCDMKAVKFAVQVTLFDFHVIGGRSCLRYVSLLNSVNAISTFVVLSPWRFFHSTVWVWPPK